MTEYHIRMASQWNMSFNADSIKQAQELTLTRKLSEEDHPTPSWFLNYNSVSEAKHLKMISNKVDKTIGLLRKLHDILPRFALLNIYKDFPRPHLGYGNIIYFTIKVLIQLSGEIGTDTI